ncbi:CD99 antigen-like protein 2 isoform X1 [Crotalus tigris]|uniref:CD99 antigen-like protein 2 isoform X1 n=1 Tax=Crotalus tigris TaxID=88082 RepID=UPI00192F1D22|nr:CD99 antigen-like protein 2 isoform X1 [Crotalus tigris]
MAGSRPRLLAFLLLLAVALSGRGYADDSDFDLSDALDDILPTKRPTHKPPKKTSGGTAGELDLSDYFDSPPERTTRPAKATTSPYPRKPDDGRWNIPHTTTTKQPKATKPPPKKTSAKDPMDFDLSDALDDQNDRHPGGGPPKGNPGGGSKGGDRRGGNSGISDADLIGIVDEGGYQPDKKKGDSDSDYNNGALVETGTIAGIVSGLAMALIGAVSSYISYQQKKFCFSIQQGLNAEYVKGENMEAVVTEEPQVKYSVLEPQTAEAPPPQENAKV